MRDLSESLRWNLELHEFRGSMQALEDVDEHEAEARAAIQDYQSGLSRYGAAISGQASTREMIDSLDLIRRDEQKTVDFNTIGPAARNPNFKYVAIPGAVNPIRPNGPPKLISYKFDARTDARDIELVFVLLDSRNHDGLSEPVYMCANEVSLNRNWHPVMVACVGCVGYTYGVYGNRQCPYRSRLVRRCFRRTQSSVRRPNHPGDVIEVRERFF